MSLSPLLSHGVHPSQDDTPCIGVVDPLNSSVIHLTIRNIALATDMGKGEVLGCSALGEDYGVKRTCGYLKPCVPPPWLGSSQIPSAGSTRSIPEARLCQTYWFVKTGPRRIDVKKRCDLVKGVLVTLVLGC